jgi:hypothetical protein
MIMRVKHNLFTYVRMHMHSQTHMQTHMQTRMQTRMQTHIQTHMHTHTHAHVHSQTHMQTHWCVPGSKILLLPGLYAPVTSTGLRVICLKVFTLRSVSVAIVRISVGKHRW